MPVEFNDQQNVRVVEKRDGLSNMVIKMGLAKDKKSAQMVLLIVAVVAAAIALFFIFSGGSEPSAQEGAPLPPGQVAE